MDTDSKRPLHKPETLFTGDVQVFTVQACRQMIRVLSRANARDARRIKNPTTRVSNKTRAKPSNAMTGGVQKCVCVVFAADSN